MKKKNILKIFSSILGIFSIVGLFVCSIFIYDHSKKSTSVNATISTETFDENLLSNSFTSEYIYVAQNGNEVTMNISGNYSLVGHTRITYNDANDTTKVELFYYLSFSGEYSVLSYLGNDTYATYDDGDNNLLSTYVFFPVNSSFGEFKGLFDIKTLGIKNGHIIFYLYVNGDLYPLLISGVTSNSINNSNGIILDKTLSLYGDFTRENFGNVSESLGSVFSFNYDFDISQYSSGYADGYAQGYQEAMQKYENQLQNEKSESYQQGFEAGIADQYQQDQIQITNSYNNGYSDGYQEGFSADSTATSIFSGILQVGLVPINFFLAIFNFDILGINISAFIRALFTVLITIIVIKFVIGSGGKGD